MSFGQLIDMNGFINTKEAESKLYEQEVELQNKYNKKEIDKQLINEQLKKTKLAERNTVQEEAKAEEKEVVQVEGKAEEVD